MQGKAACRVGMNLKLSGTKIVVKLLLFSTTLAFSTASLYLRII